MSTAGRTVTMTYDGFGRKLTEADSTGSSAWTYDALGHILTFTDNNLGKTVSYTYNALGQKTQMAVEGFAVDYRYDRLGRLAEVQKQDETHPTVYTYAAAGRRASLTLPNGVRTDYAYNPAGNLVDLLTTKPGAEEDDPRITLARFMYTVDATGNRTAIDQNLNGTIHHLAYTFDNAYRLTGETRTDTGGGLLYQEQFSYDALGNRLTQLKNGVTTARTYNSANQLMTEIENPGTPQKTTKTYSYDANGNNTGWSSVDVNDAPVASQTMTYDWLNRMTNWSDGTKSESTIYRGYAWHRITTTSNDGNEEKTTHYLYDGDNVTADYVPSTTTVTNPETGATETVTTNTLTRFYVTPFLDQNLSMTIVNGDSIGTYYYSQDGLGSVRMLSNNAAALINTYDYTAFGETQEPTTIEFVIQRYSYTAREKSATGAPMFYRYRQYDAYAGVFAGRDPMHYFAGPHLYEYCTGTPNMYRDYFGLWPNWGIETFITEVLGDSLGSAAGSTADAVAAGGGAIASAGGAVIDYGILVGQGAEVLYNNEPGAVEGYLIGLGKNPFGNGSLGQYAYTGDWVAELDVLTAATHSELMANYTNCYASCIYAMNEKVTVWLAGGAVGGFTWGGFPKAVAEFLVGYKGGPDGLKSPLRVTSGILRRIIGKNRFSKWLSSQATTFKRSSITGRVAKISLTAIAITEIAIAGYCTSKCNENPCFKVED